MWYEKEEGGPERLAQQVWQVAQAQSVDTHDLDEKALTELLHLAHRVSLMPEEGRYPKFTIFIGPPAHERDTVSSCDRPLTEREMHRVGPAAPTGAFALDVRLSDGGFRLRGIRRVWFPSSFPQYGGRSVGIYLTVEAPGFLTVQIGTVEVHMKGGYVFAPQSFVSEFMRLGKNIISRVESRYHETPGSPPIGLCDIANDCARVCQYMARHLRTGGSGGTFVVYPLDAWSEVENHIGLSRALGGPDLGDLICRIRREPCGHTLDGRSTREMLIDGAYCTAPLASVDGCVVLTDDLRVRAFSSKIRNVDVPGVEKSIPQFVTEGGMRKKSAYSLASRVSGLLALVVSQDHDLFLLRGVGDGRVDCSRYTLGLRWEDAPQPR